MADGSGAGFRVLPDRLRATAATFDRAADHWRGVLGELGVRVSEGGCGAGDGEVTEVLARLNGELRDAGLALAEAVAEDASGLHTAAEGYVASDEGAAGAFGSIRVGEGP
jgi:hypothetical protein